MMSSGLTRGALLLPFAASFLLAGCVTKDSYDRLEGQYNQLQQQQMAQVKQNSEQQAEIADIKTRMAADEEHIMHLQSAIKYTVNSDLLFAPGSWALSAKGSELIAKMAPQLTPYTNQKIVVNGYTDNAPIGAALRKKGITSNEVLSQKRAEAVRQFLISKGEKPDLVSAKGYGEADPVAPNTTAEGRSRNRRVEIELATPAS